MSGTTVSESDEGKKIVNAHGDVIGIASGVRGGTAYVDPDPRVTDKIMSKLYCRTEHFEADIRSEVASGRISRLSVSPGSTYFCPTV